jgi:hypothetical protein
MKNVTMSNSELESIKKMCDFDLIMLVSEINDHGWEVARRLIPMIQEATASHGDRRTERRQ